MRAEVPWEGEPGSASRLVSALRAWPQLRFEVTEDATAMCEGERYSSTPSLGVFRASIGVHGDVMVSEERLRAALERASGAGKPVVILKVGRSEVAARNAMAHTGAIVGSDRAFDALCRSYGAIRVDDYGDWLEQLEVLGTPRRPRGLNTVLLTNSGGEAELVAELAGK